MESGKHVVDASGETVLTRLRANNSVLEKRTVYETSITVPQGIGVRVPNATASEAFVEVLRLEEVKHVFGLVGSAFMDPLDIFPKAGIKFVSVRHEQNAALMAEGYARASGQIGVCTGQNGPGITNLVTGVAQAYANHTPMVVITPSVTSASSGTFSIQEVDQMKLLAGITNYQWQANRPEKIPWALRNAFRAARLTNGPVQVDIPRDYFYGEFEYTELAPMSYRVERVAAGATEGDISRAAEILAASEFPVLLAGLGVVESDCREELALLAERLAAPVATVFQHNDAFSDRHRLGVGPIGYGGSKAAMRTISRADVVLALGTRLNGFGTNPHYDTDYWPHSAQFIHNDLDPLQIGKNRPIAAGLPGDCQTVIQQLLGHLGHPEAHHDSRLASRLREVEEEKKQWSEELNEISSSPEVPIQPRRAVKEVADSVPADAIIVPDVGNVCGMAGAYFDSASVRQYLGPGTLGGIGVAYSTALGAKMARPDRPVVALSGDGAWSMTMQEVMTAVNRKINVVGIILNNSQYGAEKRNQYDYFDNRFYETLLDNPDFAQIAHEMGAFSRRITEPGKIGEAVQAAIASERPAVIDVIVDSKSLAEPYRRDAFQLPVRRLPRYTAGRP